MKYSFQVLISILLLLKAPPLSANLCDSRDDKNQQNIINAKTVLDCALSDHLIQKGMIQDIYKNEKGCFSKFRIEADACTHPAWQAANLVDRANYVYLIYEKLLQAHNLDYSPRILTCKVMRESTFRPQDKSSSPVSSASGLSQVTKSTAVDLFQRNRWDFKSKVAGFENIVDGEQYHEAMKTSVAAQLELGLAVLHQKSIDNKTSNIKKLLAYYYSTGDPAENMNYAQKIYDCADCIKQNKNIITEECLLKVKD